MSYIAAIDQGTTSTRCIVFDHDSNIAAVAQREHEQILPRPGWVEHDPIEIWHRTQEVVAAIRSAGARSGEIAAIGIANQRETTVVWDRTTGRPLCNAIVWQDTRTRELCDALATDGGADRFRPVVGLPLATYFSGPKIRWILDHVPGARNPNAIFGTIDTWLIWNLTGGIRGGAHVTDVTNASRTMLMNLATLDWDDAMLDALGVPRSMLPRIVSSSAPAAGEPPRAMGRSANRSRCAAIWAISRRRWWDRRASMWVNPKTPTAPAALCCSTPARSLS